MNEAIFHVINNFAGQWQTLDLLGIFFADKFLYVFVLIVIVLWFRKSLRYHVYLALGSALFSRVLIVELIKKLVNQPRPYEILANTRQLIVDNEPNMSFPSGHTVIYFSLAFAFWGTEYFWPYIIMATIGSLARVFVGLHFPFDIGASFIIAGVTVLVFKRLFKNPSLS